MRVAELISGELLARPSSARATVATSITSLLPLPKLDVALSNSSLSSSEDDDTSDSDSTVTTMKDCVRRGDGTESGACEGEMGGDCGVRFRTFGLDAAARRCETDRCSRLEVLYQQTEVQKVCDEK